MTLFGFYFLLVFVAVSIPAGIYGRSILSHTNAPHVSLFLAKTHYDTSLSNVDWLHGGAELFLTITNLFIGKQTHGPVPNIHTPFVRQC